MPSPSPDKSHKDFDSEWFRRSFEYNTCSKVTAFSHLAHFLGEHRRIRKPHTDSHHRTIYVSKLILISPIEFLFRSPFKSSMESWNYFSSEGVRLRLFCSADEKEKKKKNVMSKTKRKSWINEIETDERWVKLCATDTMCMCVGVHSLAPDATNRKWFLLFAVAKFPVTIHSRWLMPGGMVIECSDSFRFAYFHFCQIEIAIESRPSKYV